MIYDVSYKALISLKPLRIGFDKMDRIIRIYDGARYLTLSGTKKYGVITTELVSDKPKKQ